MTNKYVTNCPDENPFYNQVHGCISCDGEDEIFDIDLQICTVC
jgi:hypothetical protein